MMRPASLLATLLTAFVLLAGCGDTSTAPDVDEEKILANLRLEIPQVRDADSLRIDSLRESSVDGFYRAQLVVNNQNRVLVMIREDESEVLLLAGPPLDVGRSAEQMQASQQQESEARADVLQRASEGMPARGPADAPVTLIEFSDFQCPYCARATTLVDQLRERYPDRLRVVFMHFPLSSHEWARPAAMAAQCAARQDEDAFWRLHDFYFSNQDALTPGNVMAKSEPILAETSVNVDDWKTCATDRTSDVHRSVARQVNASLEAGKEAGVTGTPSFFVNGEKVQGARTVEAFARKIEAATGS
ncbi:MAG: thioredoxin domain-containing protein [Bacteroidetes bacterium]|jgi:protein-disulfide isomerase|nr:thioredoxin domain-containing protein [Bacteroidota bacterium]